MNFFSSRPTSKDDDYVKVDDSYYQPEGGDEENRDSPNKLSRGSHLIPKLDLSHPLMSPEKDEDIKDVEVQMYDMNDEPIYIKRSELR